MTAYGLQPTIDHNYNVALLYVAGLNPHVMVHLPVAGLSGIGTTYYEAMAQMEGFAKSRLEFNGRLFPDDETSRQYMKSVDDILLHEGTFLDSRHIQVRIASVLNEIRFDYYAIDKDKIPKKTQHQ